MRERLPVFAAVLAVVCAGVAVAIGTVTLIQGPTAADYLATINEKCDGLTERLNTDLTVDRSFDDRTGYVDLLEQRNRALVQLHDEVADLDVPDDAERPDRWLRYVDQATVDMAAIIDDKREMLSSGMNLDLGVSLLAAEYVDYVDAAGEAAKKLDLDSCADTTSWRGPYTEP